MTVKMLAAHGDLAFNEHLRTYNRDTGEASLQIVMAKGVEGGETIWTVTLTYDKADFDTREFPLTEEGDAFVYFLSAVTYWEARADFAFRILVRAERERVRRTWWAASRTSMRRATSPIKPREAT